MLVFIKLNIFAHEFIVIVITRQLKLFQRLLQVVSLSYEMIFFRLFRIKITFHTMLSL